MTLREDQQAMTRERLLDTASKLFARNGFAGASIARIADTASVSSGAIYSNFRSKEDLAVAVIERHMARQAEQYKRAMADAHHSGGQIRASADLWMQLVEEDPDYFPLFLEAARFSRTDEGLAQRFEAACQELVNSVQSLIEGVELPSGSAVPAESAATFALIVFALGNGLALQKMIQPDKVPARLFGDFLSALAERS